MDKTNTPRDAFLYFLAIITLFISAISFGSLVYQFIDLKFPDVLAGSYGRVSSLNTIRQMIAALVVVFPVFFWVSRVIRKDIVVSPEKREYRLRKWLMYFTVFVASLVIIGDVVSLLYSFLQGELTTRFILKSLTILFISGSALFYYLSELRDRKYYRKAFQWGIIAVVVAAIVCGFYLAGSPQSQRLRNFDDQKTSDLNTIQSQIVNYWQRKQQLPQKLTDLNDPLSNYIVPNDRQSNQPYEYHVTGVKSFQICAVFNYSSEMDNNQGADRAVAPGYYPSNWDHNQGRTCFDRNIDSSLYPPIKGVPLPL